METVKVHVTRFAGRCLQLQWRDPDTKMVRTRSARTKIMREAERAAVALEKEIAEGLHNRKVCSWQTFVDRAETEYAGKKGTLAVKSKAMIVTVLGKMTAIVAPKTAAEIDFAAVEKFKAGLLAQGRSMATTKSYTGMLRALLRWGMDMGIISRVPKFKSMAATESKGRPVTGEEFDRLLDKVPDVVGEAAAPGWRHLLQGLWLSGLRLGEALVLSWETQTPFAVDLSERRPGFRIESEGQKNRKAQTAPMAPEFAEFLLDSPEANRHGRVFRPARKDGNDSAMRLDYASDVIATIGKKAGVVVARKDNGKIKFASAHDLRRSFGARWSKLVMPPVLMQLMRHADIGTTMRFYVGRDSQATAEVLWAAHKPAGANSLANTTPETTETATSAEDASRCEITA